MTNMNGKIFVHNKTGNKYMVLNEAIDSTNIRNDLDVIIYAPIDSPDTAWYVREYYEFMDKFTEIS